MIKVQDIDKNYGSVEALKGVSFCVAAGEIIGLLGPNGAGKTTMIKILTGYLQPTRGSVKVDGLDVLTETRRVQQRIGYLPENAPLYPELSVQGYLLMIANLRQIPEEEQLARLSEAVRATGLEEQLARPIGQLSKGFRQRVGLAQAIVHRPRLLILDEPTIGLDPTQIVEVRHLIKRLAQDTTILLSTHILSEVEAVCDRVIILINGEVRADSRLSELEAPGSVVLALGAGAPDATAELSALGGVQEVEVTKGANDTTYRLRAVQGRDLRPSIYDLARERAWPLRELRRDVRTLEVVFSELATTSARAQQPTAATQEIEA